MAKKKFSFINEVYEGVLKATEVTRSGTVRLKRGDLRKVIETTFETGAKAAASGERVRFPVIGSLVRKEVKARKAGKGAASRSHRRLMAAPADGQAGHRCRQKRRTPAAPRIRSRPAPGARCHAVAGNCPSP